MVALTVTGFDCHVLVDDDRPDLLVHAWRRIGRYAGRYERGRRVFLHHAVVGDMGRIVFLNGDRLDCRRCNLMTCAERTEKRKAAIMSAIAAYRQERGFPPALRDISEETGISLNGVFRLLRCLEDEGKVRIDHGHRRSVVEVGR